MRLSLFAIAMFLVGFHLYVATIEGANPAQSCIKAVKKTAKVQLKAAKPNASAAKKAAKSNYKALTSSIKSAKKAELSAAKSAQSGLQSQYCANAGKKAKPCGKQFSAALKI